MPTRRKPGAEKDQDEPVRPKAAPGAPRPRRRLTVRRASSYGERETRWLWEPRIPLGHIAVIEGDPDLGKSTVTLDIAARVTTGDPFPGEGEDRRRAPACVLILSAEDAVEETINPRLAAAGADLDRVLFIPLERDPSTGQIVPVSIPEDLDEIQRLVAAEGVALVIVDPITAFLSEEVRSHNDASVRKALTPVKLVAGETGAAFLMIRHLNKSGDARALYRGGGSIAFTGAARSTLLVAPHPEDEDLRVLARVKGNLAKAYPAWTYALEEAEGRRVPVVRWRGTMLASADDLLRAQDGGGGRDATPALDEACSLLRELLADGPTPVAEVKSEASGAGVSWATMKRAKDRLGVVSRRQRDDRNQKTTGWTWELPGGGSDGDDGGGGGGGGGRPSWVRLLGIAASAATMPEPVVSAGVDEDGRRLLGPLVGSQGPTESHRGSG